jgi:hypothetical protein
MTSKSSKAKRKAIPTFSLAELDKRDGVERFDHLADSLDKWLEREVAKADTRLKSERVDGELAVEPESHSLRETEDAIQPSPAATVFD